MSIKSWKAEFYKENAYDVAQDGSDLQLIEHSLAKWEGLKPENLEKHELKGVGHRIVDTKSDEAFRVDCDSCALCQKYDADDCYTCPITKVRGYDCGSDNDENDEDNAPWHEWAVNQEPYHMIYWLTKAKENCK